MAQLQSLPTAPSFPFTFSYPVPRHTSTATPDGGAGRATTYPTQSERDSREPVLQFGPLPANAEHGAPNGTTMDRVTALLLESVKALPVLHQPAAQTGHAEPHHSSLYSPSQVADEDTPMSVASPHDSTVADPSMFTDALDSSSLSSDPASHESFEDLASDGMASPTLHEGGSSAHGRRTRAERLGSAPPPPVLGKRPAGKSPFAYPQILDTTSSVESDSPELEDVDEPEEQEKEVESDDDFELSDAADESDDDYVDDAPSPRRAKASGSRGQTGRSSPKSAKRGKSKASSTSNLGAPLDFLRFCQAAYCGISLNGTKCMACPAMKTRKRGKRCDVDGVHKNMRRHVQDQHTAVLCAMHHTGYVEPGGMLMMVLLLTPSIKEALEERPNPTVAAQIKTLEQMYGDWDPTNKTFDGFEVFDYHDDRWSVLAGRVELAIAKVDCDKCICRDKVFSRPDACLRHIKKANKRPGQEGLHAAIKGPIGERSVPQEEPVEPIPKKRKVERVPAKKGKRGVKRR